MEELLLSLLQCTEELRELAPILPSLKLLYKNHGILHESALLSSIFVASLKQLTIESKLAGCESLFST